MALHVQFQYATGASLSFSVERLGDGALYDFGDGTFRPLPAVATAPLPEETAPFPGAGIYSATLSPTPVAQFTDGDYVVAVHHPPAVVGLLAAAMHGGDDATVFPTAGGGTGPPAGPAPAPGGGDVLAAGVAWLASQLQASASEPVTYDRDGATVALWATFGRTLLKLSDELGAIRVEWTDRDFLIPAASLVLGGVPVLPRRGDLVHCPGGPTVQTFEVLPYGDEPNWRWSDPFRTIIRLHTKRISSEPT